MFLVWFDDSKKVATEEKIKNAIERYVERMGQHPNVCLVNKADANVKVEGISIHAVDYVRPGYYWVGIEDETQQAA